MVRVLITPVLILLLLTPALPQSGTGDFCATDMIHSRLMQNPDYAQRFSSIQSQIDTRMNGWSSQRGGPNVYTIPIVVHVIHLGEPVGTGSNVPDSLIHAAISNVNNRYRNIVGNGTTDTEIEFCFAARDTNGNPTTGIVRVDGSVIPKYDPHGMALDDTIGADEMAVKNLSRWPNTEYYNIWIVQDMVGQTTGFAYFPTTDDADGTVIEDIYVNGTSGVLPHELGHAFNLLHTFQGDGNGSSCPGNSNCSSDGDDICDTPPHRRGDCGMFNPCTFSGNFSNSRYNYMSYCGSTARFTADQKIRMHATLNSFPRSGLVASLGCAPSTCVTACNDNAICTIDICDSGSCIFQPVNCETISGVIETESGIPIPGVAVALSGSESRMVTTGSDGSFSFIVSPGGNYAIAPSKNNDIAVTNGITTIDLLMIHQHVLALYTLNSPYKIIAADCNNSGTISALDIAIARALILANIQLFPGGRLWEFVKSDFVFSNGQSPFPFEKTRTYTGISQSYSSQNFIGVKLGDVNDSWDAGTP